jgi:ferric-dicitrate binding protein FerR (iron transport regulator)
MNRKNLPEQDVKRFLENIYTQEEALRVFDNLPHNADYQDVLSESMDKTWDESEEYAAYSALQKEQYQKEAAVLLRKINKKPRTIHRYVKRSLSIAASIAILFAISTGIYKYVSHKDITYSDVVTTFGKIKTLQLPDGTVVTLNACSSLNFPDEFDENERRITLEGEAYFQVAKNESQPFIITTGKFDVKVLGTEFNVKAYSVDEIQSVNVKSGKVQIEMPEATIRLIANEQLKINLLSDEYSKEKEEQPVAVWKKGWLFFDGTPIRDVANELERIYNCKIEFKSGQDFNNLISGEHSNKNLKSVLESIEHTSGIHFNYEEKNKQILFYK